MYFEDGSIEAACPPLRALLHIMAHGHYEGKGIRDPAVRSLFTREVLLESEWYKKRLLVKQEREMALWTRHAAELTRFLDKSGYDAEARRMGLPDRLSQARAELERVSSSAYLQELFGTLGADPIQVVR